MLSISGHDVGEIIHQGALCTVHRARRADGVPVILKVLRSEHPTPTEIAWLRREHEVLRDLDLPGVVKALALENHAWHWVLVLEDFGGRSLDRLAPSRPWRLAERLGVAAAAAAALGQLHARNVIHKDITPANLVWNPETGVLKLIDFGISTVLSREAPAARSPRDLEGTLPYLSPEQTGRVNRTLDYRSDFYSLGATLYELFTGVPPFASADPMELVHCHIARRPVEPRERKAEVPQVVSDIVMRLLAKTPEARYQSSYGLQSDLEECIAGLGAEASSARGAEERAPTIEPFPLAQHDVTERFHVPQELYGRDDEIGVLLAAFEQVTSGGERGRGALALVTGYSGVGKSTLVQELYKPITQRRGYFIAGKFDQLQRRTPYSAFIAAFGSLMRQILSESEALLDGWRRALAEAVGSNGQVVIDLIPEVELVLGAQAPAARLGPVESQNRFDRVFQSFLRVFAQPSHPLAIFLDDLQWADSASLKLIELLFAAGEPQCLFVIGAYRDHEVGPAHPLRLTLDALGRTGVELHAIPLGPLTLADTTRLVAGAVGRPAAEVHDLARIVGQKTDGNPLFVTELLKALYQDGLLDFDRRSGRWRWDVARIAGRGIADNVVDLMVGKLRRLPEATQRAVQLAACVGSSFDLDTLATLLEAPATEAFLRLLPAIQEGFLAATSGLVVADAALSGSPFVVRDLKFPHDRVQQAAYNLIGEEERRSVHLRVGRLLQRRGGGRDRGDDLLLVVDQLNRGRSLIVDPAERRELAQRNLDAGVRVRHALAYAAAKTYVESGIECLPEASWEDAYPLAFALHRELTLLHYLNGEYDLAEGLAKRLLDRARTPIEKADLYQTLVAQYGMRARYDDALAAAKDGLALLGVDLPVGLPPAELQAAMLAELGAVQAGLAAHPVTSLLDEPEMSDPTGQAITSLLPAILPVAFFRDPLLYSVIVFKAVGVSLRLGPSSQLADLFSNYGHIVSGVLGQHVAGYEFGKLAVGLTQRFHRPDGTCRSSFLLANFIAPWSRPLHESQAINEAAFRAGLDGGETMYAGYSLIYQPYNKFYGGRPLDEVATELRGFLQFTRRTQNQIATDIELALDLAVENLRGRTPEPTSFSTPEIDEETFLAACARNQSGMARCFFYILKAEVAYLRGDPRAALEACAKAEPALIMGNVATAHHALYEALSLAAIHGGAGAGERDEIRAKLEALATRWHGWASSCPENFAHLDALVAGEIARVDGKTAAAADLYEQALLGARSGGFLQHAALAAELSAQAWLARGRERIANDYLREALHAYRLRGVPHKVDALEARLRPRVGETSPQTPSTDGARLGGLLDLGSVLKASQAISSEIVLDRLLTKLMQIVLENAGARKGAIVFEKAGELVVEVDAGLDGGDPHAPGPAGVDESAIAGLRRSTPLAAYADASEEIIRYVARTGSAVILSDATAEGRFTESPYVVRRAPKSVLCAALSSHGRLVAIIYLENNLTTGAFTPERLEVLRMLSSQIAISIENALLYRDIEERVVLRTIELQQRNGELQEAILHLRTTQTQLVQSQKMASLGRLTVGIAHEIKNPLNFVTNFAQLDVDLTEELEQVMADEPRKALVEVRDLVADLKQNASRIREHGKRADDIVRSMLRHAGSGTGERRPADLNALVSDFVRLAREGTRAHQGDVEVRIEHDYDGAVGEVVVDPQEVGRVVVNLIDNAIDAVLTRVRTAGAAYVPTLHVSTERQGGAAAIHIRDNGIGIPRANRDRLFEPFFTTKPPGMGTGLGLSLSYDIVVNGHGGRITYESVEDEETTFTVTLPIAGEASAPAGGPREASPS